MQGHEDKLYKGMQNPERITGGAVTPVSLRVAVSGTEHKEIQEQ